MHRVLKFLPVLLLTGHLFAQTPKTYTSSEVKQQLDKLNVLGSVLYIAAHPDDENSRLLAYLANEKMYRTGYLSLTRGDGGQNLIGDEQGVELGLIRTQELLAARRIDGAEQFFSRAYDFGFTKNPEETFKFWDKQKILSDVVWVIRKFQPDVIICRFPTTGEGGHGQHTASAILAGEAFDMAADPTKFPEQLKYGVTTWKAKRLLWNTFNFGSVNTQSNDQFKVEVGEYNSLLGKSYGELAAESRSLHKSQGFGVARSRGSQLEYFKTIKGEAAVTDLMDGVDVDWMRIKSNENKAADLINIQKKISKISNEFDFLHPELSVKPLVDVYAAVNLLKESYWKAQKLKEIKKCIEESSGIFIEATTLEPYGVQGDSLHISCTINNRTGIPATLSYVKLDDDVIQVNSKLEPNQNIRYAKSIYIKPNEPVTQPYWLVYPMQNGYYDVKDQNLIGMAENEPRQASFFINLYGQNLAFYKPLQYKSNDPVKGESYQPLQILNPVFVNSSPSLIINTPDNILAKPVSFTLHSNISFKGNATLKYVDGGKSHSIFDSMIVLKKGDIRRFESTVQPSSDSSIDYVYPAFDSRSLSEPQYYTLGKISYPHIPDIYYTYKDKIRLMNVNMKISGKKIGYIVGAGDKVPAALEQMGYDVTFLQEKDVKAGNLKQFDAIVTGVRAYNVYDWLDGAYAELMAYVKDGGVLLVQYNTPNVRAKIGPYPFTVSGRRITDETAEVKFLHPESSLMNYPNKISLRDFDGWIQERSTYDAEGMDSHYQPLFSMKDPGEQEQAGSLIVADYGKGRFIYSGLVFFRQLPAAVPGAYRLFANLLAKPGYAQGRTTSN